MKRYQVLLIGGFILGGVGVVGSINTETQQVDDQHYCDMVAEYKHSHGQRGWPDFREIYRRECLGVNE